MILGGEVKSQLLLDKKALAGCMACANLNPLRAGMIAIALFEHASLQA